MKSGVLNSLLQTEISLKELINQLRSSNEFLKAENVHLTKENDQLRREIGGPKLEVKMRKHK